MKTIRFHPDAEAEMLAAAAYYESQQASLGRRFLASVQDATNRIAMDSTLYPVIHGEIRRCLARVFPFGVLFRVRDAHIEVIAVMHLHRAPRYWKNR